MADERLGERELDIMQALWRLEAATVAEVHRALPEAVAYNTVQTMLNRLEGKGFVARETGERAHRYFPTVAEGDFVERTIRRLARRFFAGSAEALAVQLAESELRGDELARLRRRIEELEREGDDAR